MRWALALGAVVSAGACTSAAAQSGGVPDIQAKQVRNVDFIADLIYDSNIAHTSEALSAARGLTAKDETARPRLSFNLVQPVGREALFLGGFVGYDFHRVNKQLDHINASVSGGGVVNVGRCHSTLYGSYDASQSEPQEVPGATAKNLLSTTAEAISVACGTASGFQGSLLYRHESTQNSNPLREPANHNSNSVSGGVGYGNPSIGRFGVVGSYAKQEYPNRLTTSGKMGDSFISESFGLSYSRQIGSRLNGSVSVSDGIIKRNEAPPGLPKTTSGLNYQASLAYAVNSRLQLALAATRAYQPSNRPGKLYDLVTGTELDAKYRIGSRIVVTVGGSFTEMNSNVDSTFVFRQPTRSQQKSGYASVAYQQNRRASISAELRQEERTTDIPSFDYSDTRATLSLAVSY